MKVSKAQLKKIIKEELGNISEAPREYSTLVNARLIRDLINRSIKRMVDEAMDPAAIIVQLDIIVGYAQDIIAYEERRTGIGYKL